MAGEQEYERVRLSLGPDELGRVPGGLGSPNSTMDEWIDTVAESSAGADALRHLGVVLPAGVTVTRTRSGRWRVRGQGGSRVYRAKRLAAASVWARNWRWQMLNFPTAAHDDAPAACSHFAGVPLFRPLAIYRMEPT